MKACLVLIVALFVASSASAESPVFASIRLDVTSAIEQCRTNGDKSSLGAVLERLAPIVEQLTPETQADQDTLRELRAAVEQYKDCL